MQPNEYFDQETSLFWRKKAQDVETKKKQILISQIGAGGGAIKLDQNVPKFQVKTSLSEAICLVNGLCGRQT